MINNQGKMIIITSNEHLIEQISSNQSENTQIIDLNKKKKMKSSDIHFNFLDQLSELNSTNDQIYKDALNRSPIHRPKVTKSWKKGLDLLCVICEDAAIGFNYDVLTCASCKAFFRRNAQYNPEKLRCLTGRKNCLINHEIHRKCQRCRLTKCLSMGMRRDFILTEEEKQRRKQRIEENRQLSIISHSSMDYSSSPTNQNYTSESIEEIDRLLMDMDNDNQSRSLSSSSLSIEDWCDIEHVRSSYSLIFENVHIFFKYIDATDTTSALVSWSNVVSERSIKLINFFRQIEEFENLNSDDRFTLIKYNIFSLYIIQRTFYFDRLTGKFLNGSNVDPSLRQQFFALCYGTSGIRELFKSLMYSLSSTTGQDSTLTHLILIILLFSKGLSMSEDEPKLNDQSAVTRAQFHYIRLTWNYLLYKQGERKTTEQFIKIMGEIEKIQAYTKAVRQYFHLQSQSTNVLERLAPLMQTVLNIS